MSWTTFVLFIRSNDWLSRIPILTPANHDSQHGSLSYFRAKTPFGRRDSDEGFHILRVLAVVFVIIDGGYRL